MKPQISSHVGNDDPRQWRFERTSGLPRGYFKPARLTPDGWVFVVCALVGIALFFIP
jgi:hypothetical protein